MTTIETAATVTDRQIKALRAEARTHGDDLQALICEIALHSDVTDEAVDPGEHRQALERLGIIPEHVGSDMAARELIARVINEARAAAGEDGCIGGT